MADRASAALSKSTGAPDPLIGRSINERFRITALIARGGMGKVYRAEQAPLGRLCAVKVLNPSYAGEHDPEFHKRFFLEASIASKLTHPNTVTIFDYGRTEEDVYYMAMEYLEGHTLHRAIREAVFFPEDRAAHVARQICRALREAHSLGVVHRDLKPANIFLVAHGDESDFVKVLDFGLVKNVSDSKSEELTQTGLFMGSPKYMSPEQIRGDRVDARTDVYSLGIILYEMLTGKVPFDRANSVHILMAHVNEEPLPLRIMNPNVQISADFEQTVARCLAKDPEQRFRSMDEVLAALKRVSGNSVAATVSHMGTGEFRTLSASGATNTLPGGSGPLSTLTASVSGLLPANESLGHASSIGSAAPATASSANFSPSAAPTKPQGKGVLVASVLLAAATGAVLVLIATRTPTPVLSRASAKDGLESKRVLPGAGTAVPTTPAVTAAAGAAPSSGQALTVVSSDVTAVVKVRLNTDPEGASVREDGVEICTATPCDVTYRGMEADRAKEHNLAFAKAGFKPETRAFHIGGGPVTLKLAKVAPAWVAPAAPPKDEKSPAPAGYKVDIPY